MLDEASPQTTVTQEVSEARHGVCVGKLQEAQPLDIVI